MSAEREERVVLVDAGDRALGSAGKLRAHRDGALHRAFSVFVLNSRGEILLQRRAAEKYHTGGLWSNACCGHPRPGEETAGAAARRLGEEMGFRCALEPVSSFVYRAELGGGLVEHEYDHVFVGRFDGEPRPDPREVSEWRWVGEPALRERLRTHPGDFTPWFAPALECLGAARPRAAPGASSS